MMWCILFINAILTQYLAELWTAFVISVHNWLSIETRRCMHKCTMVFKCRNGLAPPYLINSFNANTFNHSYSTTKSSKLRIPITRNEYYHRSFLISGCNAWNNLPDYIRHFVSLNSFKLNMFKYLLAKTQF